MKVIFLDKDGVLNSDQYFDRIERVDYKGTESDVDVETVKLLKEAIDATGARVVLTTSVRYRRSGQDLIKLLGEHGISVDLTPDLNNIRGTEIKQWLSMHPDTEDFVILDDEIFDSYDEELMKKLIKISNGNGISLGKGLQRKDIEEIIQRLGRKREIDSETSNIQRTTTEKATAAKDIDIYELNLSVRTYNVLKRHGINTVSQLRNLSQEELIAMRMSPPSLKEIKKIQEGAEKITTEKATAAKDIDIYELNLSVRTYNVLKRHGINTVSQLRNLSQEELIAMRMNTPSLKEIFKILQGSEPVVQTEENPQEAIGVDTQTVTDNKGISSSGNTELEKAWATRNKLARKVEKLKQQTKSAEQLLALYDELLGITPNDDKAADSKGE